MKIPSFLLIHTVDIEPFLGNGAYGPQYGSKVSYKARMEPKRSLVRDKDGNQAVAELKGFFDYQGDDVLAESKVTWQNKKYIVISSQPQYGLHDVSHIEVMLR